MSVVYRQNDRREVKLSYGVSRQRFELPPGDLGDRHAARVPRHPAVNVSLDLGTDATRARTRPTSAGRAAATVMHQLTLWKKGDMGLQQRVSVSGGMYNERGFGTSACGRAPRARVDLQARHHAELRRGGQQPRVRRPARTLETGFMSVNLPF